MLRYIVVILSLLVLLCFVAYLTTDIKERVSWDIDFDGKVAKRSQTSYSNKVIQLIDAQLKSKYGEITIYKSGDDVPDIPKDIKALIVSLIHKEDKGSFAYANGARFSRGYYFSIGYNRPNKREYIRRIEFPPSGDIGLVRVTENAD